MLYVVLAAIMMVRSSEDRMQRRARKQDEGQYVVLSLVVAAVVASLAAIFGQLAISRDIHGPLKSAHIGLAAPTVLSSRAFMHLMFALRCVHDYHAAISHARKPGLALPGEGGPGYGDFVYLSAVIGTSGPTADVSLTTRAIRRLGAAHCVLSFFFNTTVLALAVNIAASFL